MSVPQDGSLFEGAPFQSKHSKKHCKSEVGISDLTAVTAGASVVCSSALL